MPINKTKLCELIKNEAYKVGFDSCGFSKACFLETEAPRLEKWLNNNFHADMAYMEKNFDKRLNPQLLVEGTKTIVSLTYNYYTDTEQTQNSFYKIAQYAQLFDYHIFLKEMMNKMIKSLRNIIGDFQARCFVDSAPILERTWALKSGLGWIGKNAHLIVPKNGSYYFLCQILTDLEPNYSNPINKDFCGNCTKCIVACPTAAINKNKTINSNLCISYLTIEHKKPIVEHLSAKFDKQIFGCDICQKVCPWNKFRQSDDKNNVYLNTSLSSLNKNKWDNLTGNEFDEYFKNSPLWRTGLEKLKFNMRITNNK